MNDQHDRYNLAAIRELLLVAFTPEDLRRFCQDRPAFKRIVRRFGPGHGLDDMVDRVIDSCETHLLWPDFLAEVERERPRQYARFENELRTQTRGVPAGLEPSTVDAHVQVVRTPRDRTATEMSVAAGRLPFEPELVAVPAGPFLMGTSDEQVRLMLRRFEWAKKDPDIFDYEQPQHEVVVSAFEIGRYPVTNAEYAEFVQDTGHRPPEHWPEGGLPEELADHPVVHVSHDDAEAYVNWLWNLTGHPYRLPTEAEWEKAARGNEDCLWPWGNRWDPARANTNLERTTPVGHYSPAGDSAYGCADMAGNVWEWCWDWYEDTGIYRRRAGQVVKDPAGPDTGEYKMVRGGSAWTDENRVRCATRRSQAFYIGSKGLGFRVARGPEP